MHDNSNLVPYDKNNPDSVALARENGRKGALEKHRRRREQQRLSDAIRAMMNDQVSEDDERTLTEMVTNATKLRLLKKIKNGELSLDDIQKLQKILGEEMTTVNANIDGLTPGERLNRLMNGEE